MLRTREFGLSKRETEREKMNGGENKDRERVETMRQTQRGNRQAYIFSFIKLLSYLGSQEKQ